MDRGRLRRSASSRLRSWAKRMACSFARSLSGFMTPPGKQDRVVLVRIRLVQVYIDGHPVAPVRVLPPFDFRCLRRDDVYPSRLYPRGLSLVRAVPLVRSRCRRARPHVCFAVPVNSATDGPVVAEAWARSAARTIHASASMSRWSSRRRSFRPIDVVASRRTGRATLSPSEPTSLMGARSVLIGPDGDHDLYRHYRQLSELFTVDPAGREPVTFPNGAHP